MKRWLFERKGNRSDARMSDQEILKIMQRIKKSLVNSIEIFENQGSSKFD